MFTVKEFPGRLFNSWEEYEEARSMRESVESNLQVRQQETNQPLKVTARIIPSDPHSLENRVRSLEARVTLLESSQEPKEEPKETKRPELGTVLRGESQGKLFTLEVLQDGFLCSDGMVYQSLSAAAQGVSGNRRSGWKFWKDSRGVPIGEATGRFSSA